MSGPLRKTVGEPIEYRGHSIEARYMGPDLLAYVDDRELPNFFESVRAVHAAGRRYVDQIDKEKEKSNGTHKAQA